MRDTLSADLNRCGHARMQRWGCSARRRRPRRFRRYLHIPGNEWRSVRSSCPRRSSLGWGQSRPSDDCRASGGTVARVDNDDHHSKVLSSASNRARTPPATQKERRRMLPRCDRAPYPATESERARRATYVRRIGVCPRVRARTNRGEGQTTAGQTQTGNLGTYSRPAVSRG